MTKKKWTTTFNYGAISLILCGKAETSKNSEAKGSYSYEQGKSRVCLLNAKSTAIVRTTSFISRVQKC